jgi:phage-related protein
MFPVMTSGIQGVGQALGKVALQFGGLFQNSGFMGQLKTDMSLGVGLISQLASAVTPLVQAFVHVGAVAGPIVQALGTGLHSILASGLPAFLSGLVVNADGASKGIGAILSAVSGLLGPLGTLVGTVAGALGPALQEILPAILGLATALGSGLGQIITALMPGLGALIDALASALTPIVQALAPILTTVAQAVSGIVVALAPLLPPLGELIAQLLSGLMPAFHSLAPVLVQVAQTLLPPLMSIINALVPVIGSLTQGWVGVVQALVPLLPPLAQLIAQILQLIPPLMPLITLVIRLAASMDGQLAKAVATTVKALLSLIQPIMTGITWLDHLIGKVGSVGSSFGSVFGAIGSVVSNALSTLVGIVRGPINGVIGLIDQLISYLDSIHISIPSWVPVVGGASFGVSIPQIPMLAGGGLVLPRPGGALVNVAEAGQPEIVSPLPVLQRAMTAALAGSAAAGSSADNPLYAVLDLRLDGQHVDRVLVKFQRSGGVLQSVNTAIAASSLAGR